MLRMIMMLAVFCLAGCRDNFEYVPEKYEMGALMKKFYLNKGGGDPDGDGLTNIKEINETKTVPFMRDTDCDGLPDACDPKPLFPAFAEEYEAWMSHWQKVAVDLGFPIPEEEIFFDPNYDFDEDGMDNKTEFENKTSPLAAPYSAFYFLDPPYIERQTLDQDSEEIDKTLLKKEGLWMSEATFSMRVVSHKILTGYFTYETSGGSAEIISLDGQFFPLKRLFLKSKVCGTFVGGYGLPQVFRVKISQAFRNESEPGVIAINPYDKREKTFFLPCFLKNAEK